MRVNLHSLNLIRAHLQNNYILNGGEKMYNYTIGDDVTKQVLSLNKQTKLQKKKDELLDALNNISNNFNVNSSVEIPQKLTLERKEFEPKSEEEILKQAQNLLENYKTEQEKAITDEFKQKENQLFENSEILKKNNDLQKEQLNSYYENAKQKASDEALKRGIARSSIVINQLNAFDQDQIEKYKQLDQELTNKINAIEFEIAGLQGELDKALNDFNVTYAVKLQEKINDLNRDLEKQQQSIIEYNNEIALKEAEFNKKLAELQEELQKSNFNKNTDLIEIYGKYGSNIVQKYIQDSMFNATKSLLSDLSKEEILELLEDQNIKTALGPILERILKEYK